MRCAAWTAVCALAATAAVGPAQTLGYRFETVVIPGSATVVVTGINNTGELVGYYQDGSARFHGFLRTASNTVIVDDPAALHTYLTGIDDSGLAVGYSTLGVNLPFTWQNGAFTSFVLPGTAGTPNAIDNAGVIVGGYTDASGRNRGVRHINGVNTTVDYPGAQHTVLNGRNGNGIEVGIYWKAGSNRWRGFALQNGTFTPLDMPQAFWTVLNGVNNSGWIAGQRVDAQVARGDAIVFDGVSFSPLSVPGTTGWSSANAINNTGVVVGEFDSTVNGVPGTYGFVAIPALCQPDLGFASTNGARLTVCGEPLSRGNGADLVIDDCPARASGGLVLGLGNQPLSVLGGTLVPNPIALVLPFVADANGTVRLAAAIRGGGGPASVFVQAAYLDPARTSGVGFSNAVRIDLLP